jgi:two-component system chemotaxis sensor kinase CheA
LRLPTSLTTARVLIVQVGAQIFALPIEFVRAIRRIVPAEIYSLGQRETITHDGRPTTISSLPALLGLAAKGLSGPPIEGPSPEPGLDCIILEVGADRCGVLADRLIDEQEVVIKPFGSPLKRVRNVSGATLLDTGRICIALNPPDLLKSIRREPSEPSLQPGGGRPPERKPVILLAEDSITTRTQEKRILESAGYEVVTAVDGADAWSKLGDRAFDAVVSDVEMPNVNGLALTEKIREVERYRDLPILLLTSLATEEDKKRGLDAGANVYMTKPRFDQQAFLESLRRLI